MGELIVATVVCLGVEFLDLTNKFTLDTGRRKYERLAALTLHDFITNELIDSIVR